MRDELDDIDDLSARARRQPLSAAESRALDEALAADADARLWHRVGTAFDADDAVLPGDHAAAERVLGRLLAAVPTKKPRSQRKLGLLLVAAALLVASAATATVLGIRQRERAVAPNGSASAAASTHAHASPPHAEPSAPESASPEPSAITGVSANDEPSARAAANSSSTAPSAAPETAAGLLSTAGRARRAGNASQAVNVLEGLQARFPNSPEAHASDVTLGMLLLKSGSVGGARQHFDQYLARSPEGALAADALWGKAQASFAQGDAAGARATLTTLLARFPNSAYASAARAKLRAP